MCGLSLPPEGQRRSPCIFTRRNRFDPLRKSSSSCPSGSIDIRKVSWIDEDAAPWADSQAQVHPQLMADQGKITNVARRKWVPAQAAHPIPPAAPLKLGMAQPNPAQMQAQHVSLGSCPNPEDSGPRQQPTAASE